jgi:large subunit ribosomal protein L21
MYAVIEAGGKQHRVAVGESIVLDTIEGKVGDAVQIGKVIALVDGESVKLGDGVSGAVVKGTIASHGRTQKTLVFKFKRKKQYKRTIGHRQNYTRVTVGEIVA